jgi:hypothetical protein
MVMPPSHADISALRREIAELRGQIVRIKHAYGATDVDGLVAAIKADRARMPPADQADGLAELRTAVQGLIAWAATVTPPFTES